MSTGRGPEGRDGIAVIGVGALFPGSRDASGFWRDILDGRDLVTDVPATHWLIEDYYDPDPTAPDKTYGKRGAFVPTVDFDPVEFAIPPNNLSSTDTSQLLGLVVAKQVLNDAARGRFSELDRDRISVILGVASTTELVVELGSRLQRPIWVKALREQGLPEDEVQVICDRISNSYVPWTESSFPGLLGNVVAGRIANRFDLGGTNCVLDAACASSLSAVHLAMLELHAGTSDLVIAGGVDTLNDILMYECFSKTPALSPTGDCRPFSEAADGTILGEGIGMLALKRLADAERDEDRIYAVLRGMGTSSDGRSKSIYAPRSQGQAVALRRAYEAAGYAPETVELVEAHGTGTHAGDAAEFEGLRMIFAEGNGDRPQRCALGSVKSQIGHTKAAAGSAGLFKAVMALYHRVLPPTIKVERPNPKLELERSPFYLNTEARPWIRGTSHPRRAAVSSFGFGGSNYHVTLEEYSGPNVRRERLRTLPSELILVSAPTEERLLADCRELADRVGEGGTLSHWAHRTQSEARGGGWHRLAVVAESCEELRTRLLEAADRIENTPGTPFTHPNGTSYGTGDAPGKVAFLFPGQGSQRLGMGSELAMAFDPARKVWDLTSDVAMGEEEARLHEVVFPIPVFTDHEREAQRERLTRTEWAQPALAGASLAHLALLDRVGVRAEMAGGHSFGELTALCAAGVLSPLDLLGAARRRGDLMAAASSVPGAMVAVSGALDAVVPGILEESPDVVLANRNGPHQVVFSGPVPAIEELEARVSGVRGVNVTRLPVSTAFHSPLVEASVEPFGAFLETLEFGPADFPVYANTTAAPYPDDPGEARSQLARQLAQPVRFSEQVERMYDAGARIFVEVGPGRALTGMVERILEGRTHVAASMERKGLSGATGLWHLLGRLFAEGVPVDPAELWNEFAEPPAPGTEAKPAIAIPINGANYGKPYPPAGGAAELPPPNPPRAKGLVSDRPPQSHDPSDHDPSGHDPSDHTPSDHPEETSPVTPPSRSNGIAHLPVGSNEATSGEPSDGAGRMTADMHAVLEMHRETAAAHSAYVAAMAESHMTYLNAMAEAMGVARGGEGASERSPSVGRLPRDPGVERTDVGNGTSPAPDTPAPASSTPESSAPETPAPVALAPAAAPLEHPERTAPAPQPVGVGASSRGAGLESLLLGVVSDKTGYPVEMLDLELELESGLGIDSIKRVEILSALRERAPDLPEVQPSQLASLGTLGEILSFMGMHAANGAHAGPEAGSETGARPTEGAKSPAPSTDAGTPAPAEAGEAPALEELTSLLLAVVAEKTGYPVEMLDLSLELESGLGIDSIKRVEILSALRERAPGLPEVQPSQLAALGSLGEIIRFMEAGAVQAEAGGPATSVAVGEEDGSALVADPHAGTAGLPESGSLRPLDRFAVRAVPAPAAGFALPGLRGTGRILVVDEARGIGPALVEALSAQGVAAELGATPGPEHTGAIHLGGLRAFETAEEALDVHREALATARLLAERFTLEGGVFVTVQDTGGDFGVSGADGVRVWSTGLPGLVKTGAREWPLAAVKAIDLECGDRPAEELADAIAGELLRGGPELEVGLSTRHGRVTLVATPESTSADSAPALGEDDVVIATGGARGVTATCVEALARAYRPRIALLGRTPVEPEDPELAEAGDEAALRDHFVKKAGRSKGKTTPAQIAGRVAAVLAMREVRETLSRIEAAGSEVLYLPCDVTDAKAVSDALDVVRSRWGPVTALVHGAGVLADRRIAEKTDEQLERVLAAKVGGLRALAEATREDPLRAILLFSSVAARAGNAGQADYAMANEILNRWAAAEALRRPDCRVRSLGWGPWDGGMVSPALRTLFEERGVSLIPTEAGADAFVSELAASSPPEVVLGYGSPEGALAGGEGRTWIMDVQVDEETYPELASHTVQDVPVLPVVLVVEWMARAAAACFPGRRVRRVSDLRVLRGVRLEGFSGSGDRLVLHLTEAADTPEPALRLALRNPDGGLHYSATAEFGPAPEGEPPMETAGEVEDTCWTVGELYGDHLFHGPDFQAIRDLHGFSPEGASATLAGIRTLGWEGAWKVDVVGLDGGLQLARLWGIRTLGRPSLPTGIDAVILHADGPVDGDLRCILRTTSSGELKTVSDLALLAEDGTLVAELRGVEMHLLQGEAVAE